MFVLNVSPRTDTAGDGWRTQQAFERLSSFYYRSTARKQIGFGFPLDLPWDKAAWAYGRADVIHHRQMFTAERVLRQRPKPAVIQHHGTYFRQHYGELLNEQRRRGAIGLAATLDLWLMAPDQLEWLPAPYDLEWLRSFRQRRSPGEDQPVVIAHAPTNRTLKSTDYFLAACDRLARSVPIEVLLIERTQWQECLRLKGTADIYFDQLHLGYGNNAIEAWGMGIPVICGAQPETLAEMRRRFGTLPFYEADEESLYYALLDLVSSYAKRRTFGELGRQHAGRYHADEVVVPMLEAIYRRAAQCSTS